MSRSKHFTCEVSVWLSLTISGEASIIFSPYLLSLPEPSRQSAPLLLHREWKYFTLGKGRHVQSPSTTNVASLNTDTWSYLHPCDVFLILFLFLSVEQSCCFVFFLGFLPGSTESLMQLNFRKQLKHLHQIDNTKPLQNTDDWTKYRKQPNSYRHNGNEF